MASTSGAYWIERCLWRRCPIRESLRQRRIVLWPNDCQSVCGGLGGSILDRCWPYCGDIETKSHDLREKRRPKCVRCGCRRCPGDVTTAPPSRGGSKRRN